MPAQTDPPTFRNKRRATQADFIRMAADYQQGEGQRRARGYRYVCPGCSHPDHAHDFGVRRDAS